MNTTINNTINNTTANTTINNTNNTINTNGGNRTMKNTIKENRIAEAAAKAEANKEAAREARLNAIEPIDIVETMDEVVNNTARTYRNEAGYSMGTNGGKLYQAPVVSPDGKLTTVAADSLEELEELKKNIEAGLSGDGKFHKLVYIAGLPCDCCGYTLEELEGDIAAAEDYAKAHCNGSILRDIDVAEQLVDADYDKKDLEQLDGNDSNRYLICYAGNYVMDLDGNTVVDLSDLRSKLDKEDVKALLTERLNKWIEENAQYTDWDDEDDFDDNWDEYNDCYYDDDEEC